MSDATDEIDRIITGRVGVWFNRPLSFVLEIFDWGVDELEGQTGPDDWQADVLRKLGEGTITVAEAVRIAVASGHGVGKSALVAWIILWSMTTRPHLNGVVTANTGNQLETKTWRELAVWHNRAANKHWFKWTVTKFFMVEHPETWFVAAIPWSRERSEAFAGQHAEHVLVIYDEASAIDDIIWEVSEGATTTPGAIWCAFGNPTRNTGRFRECFGSRRHRWTTFQVDSREAKMTNKVQLQQWIEDYGEDSDFVRVRVRGIFPRAGSNQFIPRDVVDAAMSRPLETDAGPGAMAIVGVDVARFGDARSVIRTRIGRDGRSWKPKRFSGLDTMQLSSHVATHVKELRSLGLKVTLFVDGGGIGGGVVDRLRQMNIDVIEVQFGGKADDQKKYVNKRSEMWGRVKEWLTIGCLERDEELAMDLIGPEYTFSPTDQIALEPKDAMKRRGLASPDDGDALAITFAFPVTEFGDDQIPPEHRVPARRAEHDPYEALDRLRQRVKHDPYA